MLLYILYSESIVKNMYFIKLIDGINVIEKLKLNFLKGVLITYI